MEEYDYAIILLTTNEPQKKHNSAANNKSTYAISLDQLMKNQSNNEIWESFSYNDQL